MKVTKTGGAGLAPDAGGDAGPEKTGGAGFAEKLRAKEGLAAAAEAHGAEGAQAAVAQIGADLKAGRVTSTEAVNRVVAEVLDRQLGKDAPAAVRERVESALRQALEDDPALATKVRALG